MEHHQPIADSNVGFADTPKRNFYESTEWLSDNNLQYDGFENPSKRARTIESDIRSPRADLMDSSLGDLFQCDDSHRLLDSHMDVDEGSSAEYPMCGWDFEDNSDKNHFLCGQSLANVAAGIDQTAGFLAGATSEAIDLTSPDAEDCNGAISCTDTEQPYKNSGESILTHNSPGTPLSIPDGGVSESKPTANERHIEDVHDTCFGYVSPAYKICTIFFSYKPQIHIRGYVIRQSLEKDRSSEDLYFDILENMVIIRDVESKGYCGFLNREAAQLVVTLSRSYKSKLSAKFHPRGSISVMIYGIRDEAHIVGDFLSDNGHFLQQPYDFDEWTTYYNPQHLIPPGSEFQASWQNNGLELTASSKLKEDAKVQAFQIVDSASGPTVFSEVQVSHRIKTGLLR